MTKKHFIDLAALVSHSEDAYTSNQINDLAAFCARHSANFNKGRFVAACERKGDGDNPASRFFEIQTEMHGVWTNDIGRPNQFASRQDATAFLACLAGSPLTFKTRVRVAGGAQ